MTIYEFKDVLLECCPATYHLQADKEPNEYIVWSEVGARETHADNVRQEESTLIAVDVLTKEEFSEIPAKIREKFREYELPYRGPEIIYHKDTQRRQYAYTVEVI